MKEKLCSMVNREVKLNHQTLKVEKQNAKALIEGFLKKSEPKRCYSSIFTAHLRAVSLQRDFRCVPKLLTTFRAGPRAIYPLSYIGESLHAEGYATSGTHIAILDRIFHIENNMKIWENLCNNGIFDIWEPEAPYNSLREKDGLRDKIDPMILLLRIFEIDKDFSDEIYLGRYSDSIVGSRVRIICPIIPADKDDKFSADYDGTYYFKDIIEKIRNGISNYLIQEEKLCDTSKMY